MGDDRLLSIADLAMYLQVPQETIYRWRKQGLGPQGLKVGRYVRFRSEDVDTWLSARAEQSARPVASLPDWWGLGHRR